MLTVEHFEFQHTLPIQVISLQESSSTEKSKPFRFRTLALTSDYLDAEAILKYGHHLEGKELRWRHNKLEDKPESLLGMVEKHEIEKTTNEKGEPLVKLWADCVIWGETEEQEEAIALINESLENDEPIGHSVGYIKITEDEDTIIRVFFRELSTTPYPKCDECRVVGVLAENQMNVNEAIASIKYMEEKIVPNDSGSSVISAEQFEAFTNQIKASTKMFETRIEQLEKEKADLQKKVVENEVVVKSLESKLSKANSALREVTKEMNVQKKQAEKLEMKNIKLTTIPQRIRLAQLEGLTDPKQIQSRVRELENKKPGDLNDQIRSIRATIKRFEIKSRSSKAGARVGGHKMSGKQVGSSTYEDEIRTSSPQQLAEKYYGV